MLGEVVGHADDLSPLFVVAGLKGDVPVVVLIHDDDIIEEIEVACLVELSRYMVYTVPTPMPVSPHPPVGELPHMPWTYPGGVDEETVSETILINIMLHDGICRRRPADVTKADKKYLCLIHFLTF